MKRKLLGLFIIAMVLMVMGCSNPTASSSSPELTPSTIVFTDGSAVTRIINNAAYTNVVSGAGSGAVTYTSGTPATATVNPSTGVVTLLAAGTSIITANKAATAIYTAATNTYNLTVIEIGSAYQGGILAYIFQSGDQGYVPGVPHGIIAATADQSVDSPWSIVVNGNVGGTITGTRTAIGTGLLNTIAIVTQKGATSNYAAGICDAYTNADTGTGVYSDWYLPSKDELNILNLAWCKGAIGGFDASNTRYWSSSDEGGGFAWSQKFFGFGDVEASYKTDIYHVRAIRSF